MLRADELEKYAMERYGENWVDAATNLGSQLSLDKNNALTYVQVIEAPGKTKDDLYVLLNYWYTSTFNDANCVINLNDKELGSIIAQGYIADIAWGPLNCCSVSIKPVIKCDIKDEKVRVTYTIPSYIITKPSEISTWTLDTCYPFVEKDVSKLIKKLCSKALVMAHAYSNVVMDKIEECVKNGMVGNEGDDW